jgi:type IV pilus assembly protein PilQ
MLSQRDKNENALLSSRGSIIVDERTNTIIVNDVAEKIAEIQDLLDLIDIPIRQVLMEAKIVIANSDFRREFGVSWGFMGTRLRSDGNRVGFSGNRDAFALGDGLFDSLDNASLDDSLVADLGVSEAATSFSLGYLTDNILLDLELSALEADGVVEIVSQPSVVSADKQKAMIKSGVEIPYQTANQNGTNTMTTVQFKEAVLQLEITPQITPDNQVIMDIMVKQDSIASFAINGEPAISVNELVNQAIVADQQTLVIGGIFHSEEINDSTQVPIMGDLPLLGNLFKKRMRTFEKREILIFITPKIIEERV